MVDDNEHKLYIRVSAEFDRQFTEMAKRMKITKSQLGNICVQSGFKHFMQAFSPEDAWSPEYVAAILKAAKKQGIELDAKDLLPRVDYG